MLTIYSNSYNKMKIWAKQVSNQCLKIQWNKDCEYSKIEIENIVTKQNFVWLSLDIKSI
jgi:hypothetical protein